MGKNAQNNFEHVLTGEESIFFRTPEANVSLIVRLTGPIDEARLKLALTHVARIHPLLRAHCVVDPNHVVRFAINNTCEVPLKLISKKSDEHWKIAIQNEQCIPFDFEKGPLIRFILLKANDAADLLIYCQHIICDGLSLVHLAEEILLFLSDSTQEANNESDFVLPIPENLSISVKQSKFMEMIKKVVIHRIASQWRKNRLTFDQEDFLDIQRAYFKKYRYEIIVIELPESDTELLADTCRKHQVTVNSAITVAFLAGRHSIVSDYRNDRQTIAVSIRNRLKQSVENAFGCYVGDIGLRFNYRGDKGFWENVQIFHQKVRHAINTGKDVQSLSDLSWIESDLMQAMTFARHMNYLSGEFDNHPKLSALSTNSKHIAVSLSKQGLSEYPGLLITNLGALNYPTKYGALELEKFYFAPSSIPLPNASLILGVVTLNQTMVITMNLVVPMNDTTNSQIVLANKIKDKAIEYLRRASGK